MTIKLPRSFTLPVLAVLAFSCGNLSAQNASPADRFKQLDKNGDGKLDASEAGMLGFFKQADRNGDGLVTPEEAQTFAQRSSIQPNSKRTVGMEGDGAAPVFHWPVDPVVIPESECPVQGIAARAADGRAARAWWRKPKGDGPFPAILFVHGGLTEFPEASLRQHLTANPVITRFLAAGYAVVMSTFRTYEQDVQSRGPIEDIRAVLRETAKLPGIDPRCIALYGGSGGGSIALELAGDTEVRAVVMGEPATVIYTGMLNTGEYGPRLEMMANPEKYFTPELRERTSEKLKTIRVPVLILHGDQHDLHRLNKPIFLPLMKVAGVKVEYREYSGYGHGFYFGGGDDRWGKGATVEVVEQVVQDVQNFLSKAMIQPQADSNTDALQKIVPSQILPNKQSLSALDRYRLWVARETAIKRQDVRAIEKLADVSRRLATSNDWSSDQNVELLKLLEQLEARLELSAASEIPSHFKPSDYPFATPRREILNQQFATSSGVDTHLQSMDIYALKEGNQLPIVVWIHGGGMKGGDKSHPGITALKPDYFLSRGYAFVSVNYRLAPEEKHPAQAEDVASAIAWLHDHAAEFGGDPDRIFLLGISAGAQLAAVVSTNDRYLAKHQKSPAIIRGAVILDIGSFDIPSLMEQAGERAPEMYRYTFRDGGNREDWVDFSPYYHVSRGKEIPPMLLYYAADREHHAVENRRFADRMKVEGLEATVLAAEGKTHLTIELEIGTFGDVPTAEIVRFFDQQDHRDDTIAKHPQNNNFTTPTVNAPRVKYKIFDSAAAKSKVSYHIYIPEIYDQEPERVFPVLYWLHGTGGGLRGIGPLSEFFDRAIQEGKMPPMLIAFPNGGATSMWCDSQDGAVPIETILVKELVPHIDANFRTLANRDGRILEGFSMGGYGAARLGFKHHDLFSAVSILAGGPLDLEFAGPRALANPSQRTLILESVFGGNLDHFRAQSPNTLAQQFADRVRGRTDIRVVVGARDATGPLSRTYSALLDKLKIKHTFAIVPDVGHDTLLLLEGLAEKNWEFYRRNIKADQP